MSDSEINAARQQLQDANDNFVPFNERIQRRYEQSQGGGQPPGQSNAAAAAAGRPDGELLVKANGQIYGGWTEVEVSCGVFRMPSSFSIRGTAKLPSETRDAIPTGSPATITIGGRVVLVGYVERIITRIGPQEHSVELVGRGRCCDLVDASAVFTNGNLSLTGASVGTLARQLVKPFAGPIQVITPDGDGDGKDFIFNVNLGESVYEILERVCRYEALIPYENSDGNLVLSRAGKVRHSSGFTEGQNIQNIEQYLSQDERFSSYIPALMASDTMARLDGKGNAAGAPVADPGVKRYRPKFVVSEQMQSGQSLAQLRAGYEALHRIGHSFRVEVVCDSWLDSAGKPWTPNQIVPLVMPSLQLKLPDMVITAVSFRRDGRSGTTANVTLMDASALAIEPSAMLAVNQKFAESGKGTGGGNNPIGAPAATPAPITTPNGVAGGTGNTKPGGPI